MEALRGRTANLLSLAILLGLWPGGGRCGNELAIPESLTRRRGEVVDRALMVSILRGGLNGWVNAGGGVSGGVLACRQLKWISPRAFFEDKDLEHITVVEVHGAAGPRAPRLIPGTISLPRVAGLEKLATVLRDLVAEKRKQLLYLVVVAEAEEFYRALDECLIGRIDEPIMYLEGGLTAYERFLRNQTAVWRHGETVRGGCPTCK